MDVSALKACFADKGYEFRYFETAKEAADCICGELSGKSIGIGGSVTVKELGLYTRLCENNTVFWHWEQSGDAREKAATAQVYLCSANAISEQGDIINIDGSGNRTASMMFGHETLYIICGVNKLEADFASALYRARNVAAPLNARRLNRKTPCAVGGELKCYDCNSPDRICKAFTWLTHKPNGIGTANVILIGETLGY